MRKLVPLDKDSWRLTEIDPVKVRRHALEFRRWLLQIDPSLDPHDCLKLDLPWVEAALNGTLPLPCDIADPHERDVAQGRMSREYIHVSSPFYNTIRGEHTTLPQIIIQNGRRYACCEFEEPSCTAQWQRAVPRLLPQQHLSR